jgi:hypothetical protein
MHKLSRIARIDVAVVALVATVAAMPAFAALPFELPFTGTGLPMRDWILMGSLALLAVAVALRLMRHRAGAEEPLAEGPDLRWWRNP